MTSAELFPFLPFRLCPQRAGTLNSHSRCKRHTWKLQRKGVTAAPPSPRLILTRRIIIFLHGLWSGRARLDGGRRSRTMKPPPPPGLFFPAATRDPLASRGTREKTIADAESTTRVKCCGGGGGRSGQKRLFRRQQEGDKSRIMTESAAPLFMRLCRRRCRHQCKYAEVWPESGQREGRREGQKLLVSIADPLMNLLRLCAIHLMDIPLFAALLPPRLRSARRGGPLVSRARALCQRQTQAAQEGIFGDRPRPRWTGVRVRPLLPRAPVKSAVHRVIPPPSQNTARPPIEISIRESEAETETAAD